MAVTKRVGGNTYLYESLYIKLPIKNARFPIDTALTTLTRPIQVFSVYWCTNRNLFF